MGKRAHIIPYRSGTTVVGSPLVITTAQPNGLPGGTQNVSYVSALNASGGKLAYSWLKTGGSAWINLDSAGNITGTPPAAGPATLTAKVTDANSTSVTGNWTFQIAAQVSSGNLIGANIDNGGFGSTRGLALSQDGVLLSRGFTQAAAISTPVALTAAGWPSADFAVILIEGQRVQSWMPGTWKCGFTGTGNETLTANGACTITKTSAPGNPNVTFDVITKASVVAGAVLGNYALGFIVTGTTGGATNVYGYIPAYGANASTNQHRTDPLWTNEVIGIYGHMASIRYMQSTGVINNTSVCTSANRNKPTNTVSIHGAPGTGENWCQEYFASMSSACHARHWMNIPIAADNTYYSSAFAGVAPFMKFAGGAGNCTELIVEIGNELWNGAGGGESGGLNNLANAYNAANPGVLNYDGTSSQITLSYRWLALRLHDLTVAARTQFGAGNVGNAGPVRIVFMTQSAPGGAATFIPTVLNFLEHQYAGFANQWVHALGGDTYTYRNNTSIPGDGVNYEGTSGTPAAIQAEWQRNAQYGALTHHNEGMKLWCLRYGMKLYSYEGVGPGRLEIENTDNQVAVSAALLDAGMNQTIQVLTQHKIDTGWDLLIDYSSGVDTGTSATSPYYLWDNLDTGLINNTTAKFVGLQAFANGGTPTHRNLISGDGSSFNGTEYTDNTAAMSGVNPILTQFSSGGLFGPYSYAWIFQVTAPGTYKITMAYAGSGAVNVFIDSVQVATLVSCASSPTVIVASQLLSAGFHSIEVGQQNHSQNLSISSLLFNVVNLGPPTKSIVGNTGASVTGSTGALVVGT